MHLQENKRKKTITKHILVWNNLSDYKVIKHRNVCLSRFMKQNQITCLSDHFRRIMKILFFTLTEKTINLNFYKIWLLWIHKFSQRFYPLFAFLLKTLVVDPGTFMLQVIKYLLNWIINKLWIYLND